MSAAESGFTLFKGKDGYTILNDTKAPSAGTGVNGDFFIDTVASDIYGPKTAGAWGTATSLLGATGATGVYGGWSSEWIFDETSIVSGTSTGDFRLNNGTLSAVTKLYINDTNGTADATNMEAFLDAFNNSGNFGLIKISKKSDSNIFWMGIVTAESDTGSEHEITVTFIAASSGKFTDNDSCVISFVESGADGTNGENAADLYDSDWVTLNDYTIGKGFGLPVFTSGWTHPKIRVIGRHVYLEGRIMIPLAAVGTPGTLIPDVDNYPSTHNGEVTVFTGTEGGFTMNSAGAITSTTAILPADLRPSLNHFIGLQQSSVRSIASSASNSLTLNTIFPSITFDTNGKLIVTTWKDLIDSSGGSARRNSPMHLLLMNVTSGDSVIDYTNHSQSFGSAATTYEIVDSGDGYTDGTHTGVTTTSDITGGAGLIFTVVVDAGKIVSVTQTAAGSGYVDGETVTLDAASGTPGIGTPTANIISTVRLDIVAKEDDRKEVAGTDVYPATFDAMDETHLGGFYVPFSFNYPLNDSVTEAQIIAAIALI